MTKENYSLLVESLNALGSLATVGAFIFLFFKDKSKQQQIDRLADISNELKVQNESMKKLVDLQDQHLAVINKLEQSGTKDSSDYKRIVEIEEKKLKLSIQPKIIISSVFSKGYAGEIQIRIQNLGEIAKLTKFNVTNGNLITHSEHLPYELLKSQSRYIFLRTIDGSNSNYATFRLEVDYEDKIGTKYRIVILRDAQSAGKIVEELELQ